MKISPIAKYIKENKLYAVKENSDAVRLYDKAGRYAGFISRTQKQDLSIININLYRSDKCREHPFLQQVIKVERTMRYFLSEKKLCR